MSGRDMQTYLYINSHPWLIDSHNDHGLSYARGADEDARPHEVPLSRQALEILRSMESIFSGSEFAFPAFHTMKPISENTVN